MIKDPLEVSPDERRTRKFTERTAWQRVVDTVEHDRSAPNRGEFVPVEPETVGTMKLAIDEHPIALPLIDPRDPAQRDPVQAQPILDLGADAHFGRLGASHVEVQPQRRDLLQVAGAREEVEHLGQLTAHDLPALQAMDAHLATLQTIDRQAPPNTHTLEVETLDTVFMELT